MERTEDELAEIEAAFCSHHWGYYFAGDGERISHCFHCGVKAVGEPPETRGCRQVRSYRVIG